MPLTTLQENSGPSRLSLIELLLCLQLLGQSDTIPVIWSQTMGVQTELTSAFGENMLVARQLGSLEGCGLVLLYKAFFCH